MGEIKMQKKFLPKVINLSLILLLSFMLVLVGGNFRRQQLIADEDIASYSTTLPYEDLFKAQVVNKTIQSISNNQFDYSQAGTEGSTTSLIYDNNQVGTTINRDDVIMLHNYQKSNGSDAELVYIAFGPKFTDISNAPEVMIDIQTARLYVNGVHKTELAKHNNVNVGTTASNYYFGYFDLNSVDYGQGIYTFAFAYTLYTYDDNGSLITTNALTYRFDFYLLDQDTYAKSYTSSNNFPDVINATNYIANNNFHQQNKINYYYNYTISQAPVVQYDAENYNLSYTHTAPSVEDVYTTYTERTKSTTNSATYDRLNIYTLKNGEQIDVTSLVANSEGHFIHTITFDVQGTYELSVLYQVLDSDTQYKILDTVDVDNYQFDQTYQDNKVADDQLVINVFGAKAYYNNQGNEKQLKYVDNSIKLDADFSTLVKPTSITSYINTIAGSNNYANNISYTGSTYSAMVNYNSENKTYTDLPFPTTNLGGISFDCFGIPAYNGTTPESYYYKYSTFADLLSNTNGTKYLLPKETTISSVGYYDVTLVYTSNNAHNTQLKFYQRFIFGIVSGEPDVLINITDENGVTTSIGKQKYTNDDVSFSITPKNVQGVVNGVDIDALNQAQFCIPFRPVYQRADFGSTTYSSEVAITADTLLSTNGHYSITVYYGVKSKNNYEFTIDKTNPATPTPFLVNAVQQSFDSPIIIGYIKNTELAINNNMTNDWFALDYEHTKESGASVTVQYEKYEFVKDSTIAIANNQGLISNGYNLPTENLIAELNPYLLETNELGAYSITSVLKPIEPAIYVFTLTDTAGNTTKYAILYDNTRPNIIVEPAPSNTYNIVNKETTLTWGQAKTFQLEKDDNNVVSDMLNLLGNSYNTAEEYYTLPVALTDISVSISNQEGELTKTYKAYNMPSVTLAISSDDTNYTNGILGGEAVYTFTIADKSMNSTVDTTKKYTIEMNLDQSLGMVFIGNTGHTSLSKVTNLYTDNITNANALYFSYIAGEINTEYYLNEADVTYTYYPFNATEYAGANSDNSTLNQMIDLLNELQNLATTEGITEATINNITPKYPFVSAASKSNQVVKRSAYSNPDDAKRIYSNVINADTTTGYTNEGMYIFRREYKSSSFDASASTDTKVRYYVMIVDRSSIIDIDSSTVNFDNQQVYDLEFYFNNGGGISASVGANSSLYVMDALTLQNYINNPMSGRIQFRTNKLPVVLTFPTQKYNNYWAFQQWIASLDEDLTTEQVEYLNTHVYNNTKFNYDMDKTKLVLSSQINGGYQQQTLALNETPDGYGYTYTCTQSGQYTLTITDPAGNTQDIIFQIVYDSPFGEFKGKNNSPLPNNDTYQYRTSNTQELYFQFETYMDNLVANIDVANITIDQIVNGSKNTYILEYNPSTNSTNVYRNSKNSSPIITNNKEIVYTNQTSTSATTYTITLLPSAYNSTIIPFDPMVEATYAVTLEYENFAELNLDSTDWKKTFYITIDRTAPTQNRENLIRQDKYYGYETLREDLTILDDYFLAVDSQQTIQYYGRQNATDAQLGITYCQSSENDSLYYRTIKLIVDDSTGTTQLGDYSYPNYSPTRTFSANATDGEGFPIFTKVNFSSDYSPSMEELFGTNYGYYELIEVDEAGNYTVYPVYYYSQSISVYNTNPAYNIIYKEADSDQNDGYLQAYITQNGLNVPEDDSNTTTMTLAKKSLQLGYLVVDEETQEIITDYIQAIQNVDPWLKVIIRYGNNENILYNNPTITSNWTDFVTTFNNTISNLENSYVAYSFDITFVNRLGEDYILHYLTPTAELELLITTINTQEFAVQIPVDNVVGGQTKIETFEVYRFANNRYNRIYLDSDENQIILDPTKVYYFRDGQYKFVTIDNFKRQKTTYYAIGIQYYNEMTYVDSSTQQTVPTMTLNVSETINGETNIVPITYTSYTAILEYNTDAYQYALLVYDATTGQYLPFNKHQAYLDGIFVVNDHLSSLNSKHRIVEIYLTQNDEYESLRFRAELTNSSDESTKIYHRFEITHALPALKLLNYSGILINNVSTDPSEPTQFSEDVYISWEESPFGQTVILTKNNTSTITIVNNHYRISEEGRYALTIISGLGYSSNSVGKTLYFIRTSNNIIMYEVVAITPSTSKETVLITSPQILTYTDQDSGKKYPLYQYYKLNGTTTEIRLNKNKNLTYKIVTETEYSTLYCIYSNSSDYGYIRYIQVNSIAPTNEIVTNQGDGSLTIYDNNLTISAGDPLQLDYSQEIKCTSKDGVTITWNYYHINTNMLADTGNIIMAYYYYNDQLVDTIYNTKANNSITLTTAGHYKFVFTDLAGNIQKFTIGNNTYDYLYFYIINDVLFTVNGAEPIPYQIFNDTVTIKLTNRELYRPDVNIAVTKNGKPMNVRSTSTVDFIYVFEDHGYYEITMTSYIKDDNGIIPIITTYGFTIINDNQTILGYNISSSLGFKVVSVIKDDVVITSLVEDTNQLWLSASTYGNGHYTVTLSYYNPTLKRTISFKFSAWINSEIPTLVASVSWGSSTSDTIIVSFNINVIYQQIGEGYISITGMAPILINATTAATNRRTDVSVSHVGENWISVYTADGHLVNSYKVIRKEPLNSMAIILIVVAVIVGIVLIVLFFVLRRRMKVR